MITVRFPGGFSVQYNDANYVEHADTPRRSRLYESKKKKQLIATVMESKSMPVIFEFAPACRAYQAADG